MMVRLVAICLGVAAAGDSSLANGQHVEPRVSAAVAAMRAVRSGFPAGPSAIVFRNDSALAVKVAHKARLAAVPFREGVSCVELPGASSCLVNRVVVTLEISSAVVDGDYAIVRVIARARSSDPTKLHYRSFSVFLRRIGGVWIVREKRPGAIS